MIINKYGITLTRLTAEDIELVRIRRNSPAIQSKMFFQKTISQQEQKKWFHSINNEKNYYFIIQSNGEKVGLIHGKIHSYSDKIAEGGMFIWDEKCLGSHIPVIASVCMADLTFLIMKMDKTIAEVRTDNPRALKYNLELGYHITEKLKDSDKVLMELTKESYFENAQKIRETVKKIAKDNSDLSWDDIDISGVDFDKLYQNLPEYLKNEVVKKVNHV